MLQQTEERLPGKTRTIGLASDARLRCRSVVRERLTGIRMRSFGRVTGSGWATRAANFRMEELTGLGWATRAVNVRMEELTGYGWATRAANLRTEELTGLGWATRATDV
ncbi:hypothetical protein ACFPVX_14275 [Cohnella faecalis]|uniref:Uncharacterized protein n=1 Tax=Cohnella faecalis TaxID=2315694 RepID=A0A398CSI6_9BACL|nr:hypothetical protein [Cohnella faecalis]RIE02341.1 hypothetical protein D3H35_16625 [Cohnella faecalis]